MVSTKWTEPNKVKEITSWGFYSRPWGKLACYNHDNIDGDDGNDDKDLKEEVYLERQWG